MRGMIAALVVALTTCAAQACPDYQLSGSELYYSGAELYQPKSFGVIAGGSQNLSKCRFPGLGTPTGYVAPAPDFELYYTKTQGYELEISILSECDSVLLINTANGNWYYDDDDAGAGDALIHLSNPSEGWYDIWIGTYGAANCDAQMILETF